LELKLVNCKIIGAKAS